VSDTITEIRKDQQSTTTWKGQSDGTQPLEPWDDGPSALAPLPMSRKQNAACAYLLSALGGGAYWEIPDINGEINMGALRLPLKGGKCTVRIPNYGGASGVFSHTINTWEASGYQDNKLPVTEGGYVEMPWRNGGGFGQFSSPVQMMGQTGMAIVNTDPVKKAMYAGADMTQTDFFPGTLTVSWQLGAVPVKSELRLAPNNDATYQQWLPEPKFARSPTAAPLAIQADFKAKKPGDPVPQGRIDFFLTDVSRHRGECCNYPRDRAEKDDLRFADQQPDNIKIDPDNPTHAYTTEKVEGAVVMVVAEDGGAYGRITARCDDLNLLGKYEPLGANYLSLPKDDDGNHIADAWEDANKISGLPLDWDEEQVAGQTATGDGISLYREYRGFRVLVGDKPVYQRLSPKDKELFVIDDAGSFDTSLWQHAGGIVAYKVDNSMVQGGDDRVESRVVDYTMGALTGQHAYAVRIETINGMIDPYAPDDPDRSLMGFCDWPCKSPKDARHVCIFPDRMRATILGLRRDLEVAITDPNSPQAQALKDRDIPLWLARQAAEQFGDAAVEKIVRQMITVDAIHEVGHACSLPGHTKKMDDGTEPEGSWGDVTCYMRYPDQGNKWDISVLQVLFGLNKATDLQFDKFCREKDYNCYSHLNVKD